MKTSSNHLVKILMSFLLIGTLFSCGKKNDSVTGSKIIINPVKPSGFYNGTDIAVAQKTMSKAKLEENTSEGDLSTVVVKDENNILTVNWSYCFFGNCSSGATNREEIIQEVESVDSETVTVSNLGDVTKESITEKIFESGEFDQITSQGICIYDGSNNPYQAFVIRKFTVLGLDNEWWNQNPGQVPPQQNAQLEEVLIISPSLPLYLNPIVSQTREETRALKKFKKNGSTVLINRIGPCP